MAELPLQDDSSEPENAPAFDATALLAQVWQQNAHVMHARVERLEYAAEEAQRGPLPEALRAEAADLAHKLAGSLGMFGYPEGTAAAQKIEQMLELPGSPDGPELMRQTVLLRSSMPR